MSKGIIYYTTNELDKRVFDLAQEYILKADLPITSVSFKPIEFGNNIVIKNAIKSYPTLAKQILTALENSKAKYVFFCEHDVLYSPTHFDFTPPRDDVYYYNTNNWRWRLGDEYAITYDRLISLSGLCCNRELAIKHYKYRIGLIDKYVKESNDRSREPDWVRKMGYEPGTKKKKRGGITDEDFETWSSEYPNIDVRHSKTFSKTKVTLDDFKHLPTNWQKVSIDKIPGWNLRKLFIWPKS